MVHVINVEIKDNHDDATLGAFVIHELVKEVWNFKSQQRILQSNFKIKFNSFGDLCYKS